MLYRYRYVWPSSSRTTPAEQRILRAQDVAHRRGDPAQTGRACQEREGHIVDGQTSFHRQPVSIITCH